MNIIYKKPEPETVELNEIDDGTFFRVPENSRIYLKLQDTNSGCSFYCYDTISNSIEALSYDRKVIPYKEAQIVITTSGN